MIKQNLTPIATASFAALLMLSACGEREPEVVGGMSDPNAGEIEGLDPAVLPPSVRHSQSYRCGDGSVLYVTYYTNDTQVGVSAQHGGAPTILTNEATAAESAAPEAGEAEGEEAPAVDASDPIRFSADGQTLVGTGNTVQYNGQTCNS